MLTITLNVIPSSTYVPCYHPNALYGTTRDLWSHRNRPEVSHSDATTKFGSLDFDKTRLVLQESSIDP
jgi:hypothetical protein